MKKFVPLIFFFLAIWVINTALFKIKSETPSDLFFSTSDDVRQSSLYQGMPNHSGDAAAFERAKISYLIDRVRQSSNVFIRNGELHTPQKAAAHLFHKYLVAYDSVKSANFFVTYVASSSSLSGKLYLMKTPDGKVYPVLDIFLNELRRLDLYLEEDRRKLQR